MKRTENFKLVVKFGGSMLGNYKDIQHTLPKLCNVLKKLQKLKKNNRSYNLFNNFNNYLSNNLNQDQKIILILSAFKTVTRKLLSLSQDLNLYPDQSDEILSYGERFTCNIVEKFLQNAGFTCKSLDYLFLPHQAQQQQQHQQQQQQQHQTLKSQTNLITTDNNFSQANIIDINTDIIQKTLENHDVIIIPGFIGNTISGKITTLGFEGSDITAITLAQFLKNDKCVLFKDVGGCFSANPHHIINAILYNEMSYDEAIILANNTNVIHRKCIEIAQKNNIQIIILNEKMNTSTVIKNMPFNEKFFFIASSSDKKIKSNNINHAMDFDINFELFIHSNVMKKIDTTYIKNTILQNIQNNGQNINCQLSYTSQVYNPQIEAEAELNIKSSTDRFQNIQQIRKNHKTHQNKHIQHIKIQVDKNEYNAENNDENLQQNLKKQEIYIKKLLHDYVSRL